ncbi:DUF5819 family protein [Terribacillus saccharophilus]|uniref:Uncharacterized protein n=1 Tax=Terribacillus saccharophilus TaxID=361277 RepID=A0A268A968_9BACI|nr:DUF5819 family protein [Terribacillus saccharophilus]PAD20662.1 hypothetical protein CHH64_12180 [Terribacillus saccharophilus]
MKKIIVFIPVILTFILITHFFALLLSVIPFNPVVLKYNEQITNYVNPLFTQTWTLFAPDPISSNDALHIKLEFEEGETEWIDTTNPIVGKMHDNYFSPYNRLGRITQSITSQMLTEEPLVHDLRESIKTKDDKNESLAELDKQSEKRYDTNHEYLLRYASSYAKHLFPNEKIETIEMRVLHQKSIPYSERNEDIEREWELVAAIKKQPISNDVLPLF